MAGGLLLLEQYCYERWSDARSPLSAMRARDVHGYVAHIRIETEIRMGL